MRRGQAPADPAERLEALQRYGEELLGRRKAPKATVYGWASIRAYRQVGRQILKILNSKRSPRRG